MGRSLEACKKRQQLKEQLFEKPPVTPRKLAGMNKEDGGLVKELEGKEQHGNNEIVKVMPTDLGIAAGKGPKKGVGTISDGEESSVSVKEQGVVQEETNQLLR